MTLENNYLSKWQTHVLTNDNYANYTIIILTMASFKDFSLICFDLINLSIRDVQR